MSSTGWLDQTRDGMGRGAASSFWALFKAWRVMTSPWSVHATFSNERIVDVFHLVCHGWYLSTDLSSMDLYTLLYTHIQIRKYKVLCSCEIGWWECAGNRDLEACWEIRLHVLISSCTQVRLVYIHNGPTNFIGVPNMCTVSFLAMKNHSQL